MVEYSLEQPYLERFREALRLDRASELLRIVEEAASTEGWPAGYWLSVRVAVVIENTDGFVGKHTPVAVGLVSAVGRTGQPNSFLSVLRFIFQNAEWPSRSDPEREGRIARFPADVIEYVKARLLRLMNEGHAAITEPVIRPELEDLYKLWFTMSHGDVAGEEIFGRINEVAADVVVQARAGRLAEVERAEIASAIKDANSKARNSALRPL
jgi:hypothetical protein